MDEIAREAGVSKRTVYDQFRSKERLYSAIIERRRDELLRQLARSDFEHADAQVGLTAFARGHLEMAMSVPVLELYRIVVAEAPRIPEPARIMFAAGLDAEIRRLAAYLKRLMNDGVLQRADPRRAAEAFIGLLAGLPTTRALMRVEAPRSRRALSEHVRFAVRTFLRGRARS